MTVSELPKMVCTCGTGMERTQTVSREGFRIEWWQCLFGHKWRFVYDGQDLRYKERVQSPGENEGV